MSLLLIQFLLDLRSFAVSSRQIDSLSVVLGLFPESQKSVGCGRSVVVAWRDFATNCVQFFLGKQRMEELSATP